MNFFKIIFITILSLLSSFACYADTDSATQNTTSATSVLENTNNNSVNADVPLNNPFSSDTGAGSEAVDDLNSNTSSELEPDVLGEKEIKKYKLSAVLIGNDDQYASFVDTSGAYINLSINDRLGENLKLVIITKEEVRFVSTEGKIISLDFNNRIEIK
jgi:hypothetical protein